MLTKHSDLVLISDLEKKKDKLLLFYTLNDSAHFLSEFEDLVAIQLQ